MPTFLAELALAAAVTVNGFTPADHLRANNDNTVRYVVQLPLEAGLKELEQIVFSSEKEEAWFYNGQPNGWGKVGQWYEIGQNASGWQHGSNPIQALTDNELTINNSAQIDSVLYHTLCSNRQIWTDERAEVHTHNVRNAPDYLNARFQEDYQTGAMLIDQLKITHAVPSVNDLEELLRDVVLCGDFHGVRSYIGSYGGVTKFHLWQDGIEYLKTLFAGYDAEDFLSGQPLPLAARAYTQELRTRIVETINTSIATHGVEDHVVVLNDAFAQINDEYYEQFNIWFATYDNLTWPGFIPITCWPRRCTAEERESGTRIHD